MSGYNYAEKLKIYRTSKKLSVKDVSAYLSKKGKPVAEKTIYGWESGNTKPNSDMLISLCELYEITDVLGTFGSKEDSSNELSTSDDSMHFLTPKEWDVIRAYRENPSYGKAVRKLLDVDD